MKMTHFKRINKHVVWTAMIALLVLGMHFSVMANEKLEIDKSFDAKDSVLIKTVSGDCTLVTGAANKVTVHIVHNYPSKYFKPTFETKGNTLVFKEEFDNDYKEHSWRNKYIKWTVTLPANTKVEFGSASGDFKAKGLKKGLEVKTASGDLKIDDQEGDVILKTASGDLELEGLNGSLKMMTSSGDVKGKDIKGDIEIRAASGDTKLTNVVAAIDIKASSGDVEISGVEFTGASQFTLASGDIEVSLAKTSNYDLTFSTASGDMVIDYNGNPLKGYYVFKGKIDNFSSDVSFEGEDVSRYSAYGKKFLNKGDSPRITFKTASGDCSFKK